MKKLNARHQMAQIDLHIAVGNDLEMQKRIDEILKQQVKKQKKGGVKVK